MKILITGGSGLLGQYLNLLLSKDNEICSLYNLNPGNCLNYNSYKIDITDSNGMSELFSSFNPDVVIHTACFSRPETCASAEEDLVLRTNIDATENISELCEKYKAKLIYTSTDLVYDGYQGEMLKENAILNPLTLYARTKLSAEEKIQNTFNNFIILRTALLFGIGLNHSRNNFHYMYDNFKSGKRYKLFYDQFRTPLSLLNAAEIIAGLCNPDLKNIILNFGGKERVSRAGLAEILCDVCKFDKNLIDKISMDDIEGFTKVPDVSLNTGLLQSYGFNIYSLQESVEKSLVYTD